MEVDHGKIRFCYKNIGDKHEKMPESYDSGKEDTIWQPKKFEAVCKKSSSLIRPMRIAVIYIGSPSRFMEESLSNSDFETDAVVTKALIKDINFQI